VVGACKHLGVDPFAYLREVLLALFTLGDNPGADALTGWQPDTWRQRAVPVVLPVVSAVEAGAD
jgi:hypothetical protein